MANRNQKRSFEEIYREFCRAVFSLFSKKGFSREDSEDLSQKTFLRVHENWDRYRGDAIWEYLVVTARSVLSNHLRELDAEKRGTRLTGSLDAPGVAETAAVVDSRSSSQVSSPLEDLESKVNEAWLVEEIEELPDIDRRCLLLWIGGRTFREIGNVLGSDASRAKTRCFRIREKLRKRWEDESQGEPQS